MPRASKREKYAIGFRANDNDYESLVSFSMIKSEAKQCFCRGDRIYRLVDVTDELTKTKRKAKR